MYIALVTGASSGIGREFALSIDKKMRLDEIWLIARRKENLLSVAQSINTKSRIIELDLSEKESLEKLNSILDETKPSIKVLVNAAGVGKFGHFEDQTEKEIHGMIDVNITALTMVTKMCIPYMLLSSGIINMASISGYVPVPCLNVYSASKAYVLHFSEALACELKNENIKVTAVCPYWVATEFITIAENTADGNSIDNFSFITYPFPLVQKALKDNEKGKIVSVYGIAAKLIKCLSKTIPVKCQTETWDILRKLNSSQCNPLCPVQSLLRGLIDRFHSQGTERQSDS